MRVVRQSVEGDHPTPGRGQAIAPTMDGPGTPLRGHSRGAPLWSPWGGVVASESTTYLFAYFLLSDIKHLQFLSSKENLSSLFTLFTHMYKRRKCVIPAKRSSR